MSIFFYDVEEQTQEYIWDDRISHIWNRFNNLQNDYNEAVTNNTFSSWNSVNIRWHQINNYLREIKDYYPVGENVGEYTYNWVQDNIYEPLQKLYPVIQNRLQNQTR